MFLEHTHNEKTTNGYYKLLNVYYRIIKKNLNQKIVKNIQQSHIQWKATQDSNLNIKTHEKE